ncbi:TlpA family protein disulfide reductase [Candidatus Saganbacteria bacterium]|nr:TlpA family protein disulfide reductase [Candidatus Saganbacteria bacterium]
MTAYTKTVMKLRLTTLIVLLLLAAVSGAQGLPQSNFSSLFNLKTVEGKTLTANKYFNQGATILAFFTSWSKTCQQEINFLSELNKEYGTKGLKIMAVSYDRKIEDLNKFINENKIVFDVLHDKKLTTLKDFQVMIIPALFVIDETGKVLSLHVDFDDNVVKAVNSEIKKLLAPGGVIHNAAQ